MLDRSAIAGAIGFSKSLDRRFGRKTTGAKMTDVPGHSRGLIGPLAENGVTLPGYRRQLGQHSRPMCRRLSSGRTRAALRITMMYHRLEYGGVVRLPASDLAVAVEVRDDNAGPHTLEEIRKIYADLRRQFPNATIRASNLTEIANAVEPHKSALPVLTQEIGDTWIYGVASDPVKLARYREVLRLRGEWIREGKLQVGDKVILHSWRSLRWRSNTPGEPTPRPGWTSITTRRMLWRRCWISRKYKTVTGSWVEKRANIDQGIATLPPALRAEANAATERLKPVAPETVSVEDARRLEAY